MINSYVTVELTSADMTGLLRTLNGSGIPVFGMEQRDSLTVVLKVIDSDALLLRYLAEKAGATLRIITVSGPVYWLKGLLSRPLLIIGMVLLLALVIWLPTRVLFISVEGNQYLPTYRILDEAEQCGILFGASRREVRSEKMKNALLAAIPELQWAGINTFGCTAVISVEERISEAYKTPDHTVSSIIAVRDGVIESCISSKGDLLCKPGQAVKKGDVLISGYTDCGIKITADRAEGEIFAKTVHEITVVTPTDYRQKGTVLQNHRNYSLLIGKKRINFFKGSGISGMTCDKLYKEYYVRLPGGFQLPLALAVTETIIYDEFTAQVSAFDTKSIMQNCAQGYLLSQMVSGKILYNAASVKQGEYLHILHGRFLCSEMIGRTQTEGLLEQYGKDN